MNFASGHSNLVCNHTAQGFTNVGCRVPLDIVELIMEQLASFGALRSLRSCCHVCKDFVAICEKQIFTNISVSNKGIFDGSGIAFPTLASFKKVLDNKPRLESYIRTLRYCHDFDQHSQWPPVFRCLRHLWSLRILFKTKWNTSGPSSRIRPSFESSFFRFLQTNQITHLELWGSFDLPTRAFALLPHLQDLTMRSINLANDPPFVQRSPPKLRSLCVRCEQPVDILIAARHGIVDLRALRHFEVNLGNTPATMRVIRYLLQQSEVIESLKFEGELPCLDLHDTLARYLSTKSLGSLRHIELFIDLFKIEHDPYLNLAPELARLSGRNVLETLILTIMVPIWSTCNTDFSRWSELDRVLSQPKAFPRLRRVQLSLDVSYMHEHERNKEMEEALAVICDDAFPWLKENGEVEFDLYFEVSPID